MPCFKVFLIERLSDHRKPFLYFSKLRGFLFLLQHVTRVSMAPTVYISASVCMENPVTKRQANVNVCQDTMESSVTKVLISKALHSIYPEFNCIHNSYHIISQFSLKPKYFSDILNLRYDTPIHFNTSVGIFKEKM